MLSSKRAVLLAALCCIVSLASMGCEDSEQIAPAGSTITVSATPTTVSLSALPECVDILGVQECGTSQIVATVRSELGIPLPDQDVRFDATAGVLYTGSVQNPVPASNIPIPTDSIGNAHVNLITSATTTVTATSGTASGNKQLTTVQGNLSSILLNNDTASDGCSGSSLEITTCTQSVCLVAKAQDSAGTGVQGVIISFELQNNVLSGKTFSGNFVPGQVTTDSNGEAHTVFTPDSTCQDECAVGTGGGPCQGEVVASGSGLQSIPLQLTINVP